MGLRVDVVRHRRPRAVARSGQPDARARRAAGSRRVLADLSHTFVSKASLTRDGFVRTLVGVALRPRLASPLRRVPTFGRRILRVLPGALADGYAAVVRALRRAAG